MKTSLVLAIALILNTTILFAEPLLALVRGINPWVFGIAEGILVMAYFINRVFGNFSEAFTVNFGHLEVFVVKIRKRRRNTFDKP